MTSPKIEVNNQPRPRLLTAAATCRALGLDRGQFARESRRSGFPVHTVKGQRRYRVEEVRGWRESNVRMRRQNAPRSGPPLAAADHPFIITLMSGTASALDISRAAMQLAARVVAVSSASGTLRPTDFDGLKVTLQELRAAESGYVEIDARRRTLITRENAVTIIIEVSARLERLARLIVRLIGTTMAEWLVDPAIAAMPPDDRARKAREYVAAVTADVRRREADEIDAMLGGQEAKL